MAAVVGGTGRNTPGGKVICNRKSCRSISRVIVGDPSTSDLLRTEPHSWYAVAVQGSHLRLRCGLTRLVRAQGRLRGLQ